MSSTPVVVLDSTLTDIADAIRGKNGSSDTYKPSEMPAAITAIPSGGGGSGIPKEVDANGFYGFPIQQFTFSLPSTAVDLADNALYYAFRDCTSLTSVDLSSLTTASRSYALYYAFKGCTSLTSADLSSLTTVSGSYALSHTFTNCTSLVSVDLSSLTKAGWYALESIFSGCTSLTSVDLSSLVTISGVYALSYAFYNCTSLTSVNLSSLATISGSNGLEYCFAKCPLTTVNFSSLSEIKGQRALYYCFQNCTSLSSLSFPALTTSSFGSSYTDQFNNMLKGVTGCTVHFPAAIQSTIGSWSDVTNGFGGTNTTVLFDL